MKQHMIMMKNHKWESNTIAYCLFVEKNDCLYCVTFSKGRDDLLK